jgi:hypothetical protein
MIDTARTLAAHMMLQLPLVTHKVTPRKITLATIDCHPGGDGFIVAEGPMRAARSVAFCATQ